MLQPENPTNNLLPSTVTVLTPSVHISTTNQGAQPTFTLAVPTNTPIMPPLVNERYCPSKRSYSCPGLIVKPVGCRCDELCKRFGDCCSNSNYVHNANIPSFECVSNIVLNERKDREAGEQYYWMIASCPESESESDILNRIADLCKAHALSSPPVSDNSTGLVYRNKYCAQCHGVPDKELITWPSVWHCNITLTEAFISGSGTVDMRVLLAACNPSVFEEPQLLSDRERAYPLRECDRDIIYKCQPPPETNTSSEEYHNLERLCRIEPGKATVISTAPGVYKNEYCALCSSLNMDRNNLRCPPNPPSRNMIPPSFNTFPLLLDVTGSGIEVLSMDKIEVTSIIEQSCAEGQVYDVYSEACRESPCPPGFDYSGSSCLPIAPNCTLVALNNTEYTRTGNQVIFWIAVEQNVSVQWYNSKGNPLVCTNFTSNFTRPVKCTLIALNDTEYHTVSNQIIFWFALEQNISVQGYNSEGNPLVCTNFTTNFTRTVNETITRTLFGYPAAFGILSYLGLSVDVVAAAILLFTYAAFAKMRTFYGKLFMNFILVLLLGDLTFLLGAAVYGVSLDNVVCQVVAILLHYLFLARFVWMSLLSLNVARHFYHAAKFIINEERESWCYLVLYMAAGWLSPLLVLIVTVPLNYAVSGTVGYGVDGLCWMNQTLAIIVSFIVPLAICILFTIGAFVFVCIILVKLHRSRSDVTEDVKHKTGFRNCRVLVAVFCVTGGVWLFGFLALIDSALSWAWYIFIILNTTQAVFLTLAYICTAKVLRLYHTALTKAFPQCGRKHQATLNTDVHQKDEELQLQNK